jgi:putative oxidoreductase
VNGATYDHRSRSRITGAFSMWKKLIATPNEWHWTLIRLAAGIMIFPHGLQKAFGVWGGRGLSGQLEFFQHHDHIPLVFAFLAIMAELLGGIGLITGFLTRVAAFGLLCNMTIGPYISNLQYGYFLNWTGQQKGEGIEFHILAAAMALTIVARGAGAFSVDRLLMKK